MVDESKGNEKKVDASENDENCGLFKENERSTLTSVAVPGTWKEIPSAFFKVVSEFMRESLLLHAQVLPFCCTHLDTRSLFLSLLHSSYPLHSCIACTRSSTLSLLSFKQGCVLLKVVNIPKSVTAIGDAAFQDCTALTTIALGDSVTTIGKSAFQVRRPLPTSLSSECTCWMCHTLVYMCGAMCGSLDDDCAPSDSIRAAAPSPPS